MKKFLKKILLFLCIFLIYKLLVCSIIFFHLPKIDHRGAFYGDNTKSNSRIILIGASNLKFNYDYELLNKSFKKQKVIGCYLNEPSGLMPLLERLELLNPNIKDTLIFCLPHSFYEKDKFIPIINNDIMRGISRETIIKSMFLFPKTTLSYLFSINPFELNSIKVSQKKGREYFEFVPKEQQDSLYINCWTNKEGNFSIRSIFHETNYLDNIIFKIPKLYKSKVYFRFPAIQENNFEINMERVKDLIDRLDFINDFEESIYMDSLWYNQWYHLNKCGQEKCTGRLITELSR